MREAYAKYVEKNGKKFIIDCKASAIEEAFYKEDSKKPEKIDREYAVSPDHPNALVVNCIQVSTFYNKNDHYFIPTELWKAKDTGKCMIADWDHDRGQIIGCISDTYAVDQDGAVLDNSFEIAEDISFDVYNEVVVWEKQYPEYAEKIKKMHENDTLFVSMECTFEDFNFALQKDGEESAVLVERNSETDFLTDSLLIFGGSGKYKNYRVGVAFENISFVGVGFVEQPANERSFVLDVSGSKNIEDKIEDALKEQNSEEIDFEILIEANKMEKDKEENKEEDKEEKIKEKEEKKEKDSKKCKDDEKSGVKDFKEEKISADCVARDIKKGEESMEFEKLYEKASQDLEQVKEELASIKAEAVEVRTFSRKDSGEDEYSYVTTDYEGNEVKVTEKTAYTSNSVTTITQELIAKIKELETQKAEVEKTLVEATEKLSAIETERKQEARKVAIAEKDVEIEDEELFAMSDDAFEAMIKFAPAKVVVEEKAEEVVEEKSDEEKEAEEIEKATEQVEDIEKEDQEDQKEEIANEKDKDFKAIAGLLKQACK